jgi:phage shock protein A
MYDLRDGLTKQLVHARGKYEEQIAKLESQRKDIDESIKLLRTGLEFVDGELTKRKGAGECAKAAKSPKITSAEQPQA